MATFNVSTWDEFVAAYTAPWDGEYDADVIEIMADLDVNTNPPTSVLYPRKQKIINGNFHTIWNLAPGGIVNDAIVYSGGAQDTTWNKINFNNIAFLENRPVFYADNGRNFIFNDCTFVAKVSSCLFENATLNRCAVTMTGSTTHNAPMYSVSANQCWIHYEHNRTVDVGSNEFAALNTCYVEGKINTTLTSATDPFPFTGDPYSCVFNVEVDNVLPCSVATGFGTVAVSVFNTDKITNYTGTRTEIVGVTDAQLKDATYLASVGFDIVT